MARLILSLAVNVLAEYNRNKERYTIGRLPDNDIRIDNPAVSGHHSLIINILNDSFLEDLNSTNRTYVNGKLIHKHAMQHASAKHAGVPEHRAPSPRAKWRVLNAALARRELELAKALSTLGRPGAQE